MGEPQLEKARRWRSFMGLSVDERSVVEAARRSGPDGPTWHTAAEGVEVDLETQWRGLLLAAVHKYGAEQSDQYGGLRFDWRDGRRILRVGFTDDLDRHRVAIAEIDSEGRIAVETVPFAEVFLAQLRERILADNKALLATGIELMEISSGWGAITIGIVAADGERAQRLIAERYGPAVLIGWIEPSRTRQEPQPFDRYDDDARALTVFFGLPFNGERPGELRAVEHPDRVVVSFHLEAPVGMRTLIGGVRPSQATILLDRELGDRIVIDGFDGERRPRRRR